MTKRATGETWDRYYALLREAQAKCCKIEYVQRHQRSKRALCSEVSALWKNIAQLEWVLEDPKNRECRIYN